MLPNRVKHGMSVSLKSKTVTDWQHVRINDTSGVWEVLDRAPGGASTWWLHRRTDSGRWESVKLDAAEFDEISPRLEWDVSAPLNPKVRAGSYAISSQETGYINVSGYIAGQYGAHNRGLKLYPGWTITHLPTGLSLPAECHTMPEAKALLARLGELDPLFVGLAFGERPTGEQLAEDIALVKPILKPELVNA